MLKQILALLSITVFFVACDFGTSESDDKLHVVHGEFVDSRDGQTYKTVTIESQTWMAENLNYKTDSSYCYNDSIENCEIYGRLYEWSSALTACPEGWRLSDYSDWNTLENVINNDYARKLRASSGWAIERVNGSDAYGFNVLPGGECRDGHCYYKGYFAKFWINKGLPIERPEGTDYETFEGPYGARQISVSGEEELSLYWGYKTTACSVRCIKE